MAGRDEEQLSKDESLGREPNGQLVDVFPVTRYRQSEEYETASASASMVGRSKDAVPEIALSNSVQIQQPLNSSLATPPAHSSPSDNSTYHAPVANVKLKSEPNTFSSIANIQQRLSAQSRSPARNTKQKSEITHFSSAANVKIPSTNNHSIAANDMQERHTVPPSQQPATITSIALNIPLSRDPSLTTIQPRIPLPNTLPVIVGPTNRTSGSYNTPNQSPALTVSGSNRSHLEHIQIPARTSAFRQAVTFQSTATAQPLIRQPAGIVQQLAVPAQAPGNRTTINTVSRLLHSTVI